jgi:tRNA G10  N-methylase Trm11
MRNVTAAMMNKQEIRYPDAPVSDELGGVDTSLLYDELRTRYGATGRAVEVDFRRLVDWVRLGDQLSHQVHSYPAKLLPNIAHFFANARILARAGQPLLDPFCGSGTVALEASVAGLLPYVADANPLALLLTRVKTTPFDSRQLRAALASIRNRARRFRTALVVPIVNDHLWYLPHQKKRLEVVLRAILEEPDELLRDFFKVSFSTTARRLSLSDLAVSVPVRLLPKPHLEALRNQRINERLQWIREADPLVEFIRTAEANIYRVEETNRQYPSRVTAISVGIDARNLRQPASENDPLPDRSVRLIVTSPPYGSAQKYIRASSLSLNWLNLAGPDELADLEALSIGREHLSRIRDADKSPAPLSKAFRNLIKQIEAINPLRARITQRYLEEMRSAVAEMSRVVEVGGHVVVVIGNNRVCGLALRNDKFLMESFAESGMRLEVSLVDHIKSRGLMTKRNKTASVISRESVLVFVRTA